ncbi:pleckstrin domain-containing protein [Heterostelium album PN500]|uniref:Pleckstrin domain-containing protein n=1 Tax=Heterostelium pallidum (strain ATCC 26659 / Pp 5 / PN500) TaxID=670386 RepID=D3BDR7_HETP5|nr:pleckstrin domain-containing protein [Heterostelium album PN500]EFA80048.1 pleckstrin domain-containing protein [Heterostelium album PN500]|eukprot:XP_020432168.1 pleckstrin domain-containing protein [Heterostelium album PN500]
MTKHCSSCGNTNCAPQAKFCTQCGNALASPTASTTTPTTTTFTAPKITTATSKSTLKPAPVISTTTTTNNNNNVRPNTITPKTNKLSQSTGSLKPLPSVPTTTTTTTTTTQVSASPPPLPTKPRTTTSSASTITKPLPSVVNTNAGSATGNSVNVTRIRATTTAPKPDNSQRSVSSSSLPIAPKESSENFMNIKLKSTKINNGEPINNGANRPKANTVSLVALDEKAKLPPGSFVKLAVKSRDQMDNIAHRDILILNGEKDKAESTNGKDTAVSEQHHHVALKEEKRNGNVTTASVVPPELPPKKRSSSGGSLSGSSSGITPTLPTQPSMEKMSIPLPPPLDKEKEAERERQRQLERDEREKQRLAEKEQKAAERERLKKEEREERDRKELEKEKSRKGERDEKERLKQLEREKKAEEKRQRTMEREKKRTLKIEKDKERERTRETGTGSPLTVLSGDEADHEDSDSGDAEVESNTNSHTTTTSTTATSSNGNESVSSPKMSFADMSEVVKNKDIERKKKEREKYNTSPARSRFFSFILGSGEKEKDSNSLGNSDDEFVISSPVSQTPLSPATGIDDNTSVDGDSEDGQPQQLRKWAIKRNELNGSKGDLMASISPPLLSVNAGSGNSSLQLTPQRHSMGSDTSGAASPAPITASPQSNSSSHLKDAPSASSMHIGSSSSTSSLSLVSQSPTGSAPLLPPNLPEMPQATDQRSRVIEEIIVTERDYIRDMEIMVWMRREMVGQEDAKGAALEEINILFSNVEQLLMVNHELYKKFVELPIPTDPNNTDFGASIANAFISLSQFLKSYFVYCSNQQKALSTFSALRGKNCSFLGYLLTRRECRSLPFDSFLIKPVQRVCKYPLLLRELIKSTPNTMSSYTLLQEAQKKIESIVSIVNEKKREFDGQMRICHQIWWFQTESPEILNSLLSEFKQVIETNHMVEYKKYVEDRERQSKSHVDFDEWRKAVKNKPLPEPPRSPSFNDSPKPSTKALPAVPQSTDSISIRVSCHHLDPRHVEISKELPTLKSLKEKIQLKFSLDNLDFTVQSNQSGAGPYQTIHNDQDLQNIVKSDQHEIEMKIIALKFYSEMNKLFLSLFICLSFINIIYGLFWTSIIIDNNPAKYGTPNCTYNVSPEQQCSLEYKPESDFL